MHRPPAAGEITERVMLNILTHLAIFAPAIGTGLLVALFLRQEGEIDMLRDSIFDLARERVSRPTMIHVAQREGSSNE
ncbi:MAG: hypothetical protein R3D32_10830 [Nitratireductor sp.]